MIYWLNKLFYGSFKRSYTRFLTDSKQHNLVQDEKLLTITSKNKHSKYGKANQFESIRHYEDFKSTVPLMTESILEHYTDRLEKDGKNLTSEDVLWTEKTSGSSTHAKTIPYTQSLVKEFQQGLFPWLYSLSKLYPNCLKGPAYWIVSPPFLSEEDTPEEPTNDGKYFNLYSQLLLWKITIAGADSRLVRDKDDYFIYTLINMLNTKKMAMISVWSPSIIQVFDNYLRHDNRLKALILEGNIVTKKRQKELLKILEKDFSWRCLWPNLELLSCWTDASSAIWLTKTQEILGQSVHIQGKGLLSTEGITSIPLFKDKDSVLSYRSHFYEFQLDNTENIYRSHELKENQVYEVILTTASGLYRYPSGDLVRITGHYNSVPCMRFVGRKSISSDVVGEKISDFHVSEMLLNLKELLATSTYAFLYPIVNKNTHKCAYTMYLVSEKLSTETESNLLKQVSIELSKNPYYAQAIQSGQLDPVTLSYLTKNNKTLLFNYLSHKRKSQIGTFKPPVLFRIKELQAILKE